MILLNHLLPQSGARKSGSNRYNYFLNINNIRINLVLIVFLLLPTHCISEESRQTENNSIKAKLVFDTHTARLSWRMKQAIEVSGIEAYLDDNPLTTSNHISYPQTNDTTGILFLIDTSDPGRDVIVQKQILVLIDLLKKTQPHYRIALGEFSSQFKPVAPFTDKVESLIPALSLLQASGTTTELYRSLIDAIQYISNTELSRRYIFVFSDGLAEDQGYAHSDVLKAANESDVVIYALGYPASEAKATAMQTIRRLAEETGGYFTAADSKDFLLPQNFIDNPYSLLDTGGSAEITIGDPYRLPWEAPAFLKITLNSADKPLEFSDRLELRQPTLDELITLAFTDSYKHWTLAIIGFFAVIILWLIYRITKPIVILLLPKEKMPPPPEPLGFVEILGSSEQQFAIIASSTRIGRNPDNELQFDNTSVSGNHACINIRRDGSFMIKDLNSANGILLNGKKIEEATLNAGDLIELGDVRLRYTPAQ
ncbi:MAG: FHA domain-containing protein [Candidatus Thiodiazotropha taylori]